VKRDPYSVNVSLYECEGMKYRLLKKIVPCD
jgi:hypothetical protein